MSAESLSVQAGGRSRFLHDLGYPVSEDCLTGRPTINHPLKERAVLIPAKFHPPSDSADRASLDVLSHGNSELPSLSIAILFFPKDSHENTFRSEFQILPA